MDVRRRSGWRAAAVVALTACRSPIAPPEIEAGEERDVVAAWSARLEQVVSEDGLVDYDALEADRGALDAYVAWLAAPRGGFNRENDRYGFWINAYNTLVIYGVLAEGRPASVLDVQGWIPKPGSGFFVERTFTVDGSPISLSEIEHERLRMRVYDPRIHAALNCASRGCPPLRRGLFEQRHGGDGPRRLERELDEQMARWLGDPRGLVVEDDTVVFSSIFDWFGRDFTAWTPAPDLCSAAAFYARSALRDVLHERGAAGCEHRFAEYDWRLNDVGGR